MKSVGKEQDNVRPELEAEAERSAADGPGGADDGGGRLEAVEKPSASDKTAGDPLVTPTEVAREFGFLVITRGRRAGSFFRLERPRALIGRSSRVQVRLDDTRVAGEHASIRCERMPGSARPEFVLRDLDSETGTYVNGIRISALHVLADGDRIQTGETELAFKRV